MPPVWVRFVKNRAYEQRLCVHRVVSIWPGNSRALHVMLWVCAAAMHAQVALLLLLRASVHVSRSVTIYLFSILALYYTKASLTHIHTHSLTLCHSSAHCSFFHNLYTTILIHKYFSTSYAQTYPQDNPLALYYTKATRHSQEHFIALLH